MALYIYHVQISGYVFVKHTKMRMFSNVSSYLGMAHFKKVLYCFICYSTVTILFNQPPCGAVWQSIVQTFWDFLLRDL